jgi:hypothetical protein
LEYYNISIGATIAEIRSELQETDLDKYKNPKGTKHDLGKDGAFSKFSVIVGNFFHRTGEFKIDYFKYNFTVICGNTLAKQRKLLWNRKDLLSLL